MNSIALWKDIILSPSEGFPRLNEKPKALLPLLVILVLALLSSMMTLPLIRSEAYTQALVQAQMSTMAEKGQSMSDEQARDMAEQLRSPQIKTITTVSAVAGGTIGFIVILLAGMLILKLCLVITKTPAAMGVLFRLVLYLALITCVQLLLKNLITVTGDWARDLRMVQSNADLQMALQSPISLAALFSADKIGRIPYLLIDTLTDIFNYIYYVYLYFGLRYALKAPHGSALTVTVIYALFSIGVGLAFLLVT